MSEAASTRDWTFRDAGRPALPLRLLNAVGRLAPRQPSLKPDSLIETAVEKTGLSDFGGDEFREALEVLCDSLNREANLHTFGRMAQRKMLIGILESRLQLFDWAAKHPEVRDERIAPPIVVLGLPRTGTTLLSHLLDLDPRTRSLRQWEAGAFAPPPQLATRDEDPRLATAIAQEKQIAQLIPPLPAMHPLGATLPTECVPLHMLDFRSLGHETQALVPSYGNWLERCDMRSAYAVHKLALQTLQSTIPTGRWALKTPNHLWALERLHEFYPDATLVWTHRDPARVVPSVASLNTAFHRTFTRNVDPKEVGRQWSRKLLHALNCGMEWDDQRGNKDWCQHVLYEDLMRDPVGTVRGIYAYAGEELDPLHEALMLAYIENRPQNAFGRHRYDMNDFEMTTEGIDEAFGSYSARYEVPRETRD
ncbi:MAG: sulfotransferase [Myxococcota bacterium]|nr:sulfotransferase [Myxococcota bacterium]